MQSRYAPVGRNHTPRTSRKGVSPGSMSYHPAGVPHGPHPGSYEASIGTKETNELAVMIDTAACDATVETGINCN